MEDSKQSRLQPLVPLDDVNCGRLRCLMCRRQFSYHFDVLPSLG